MNKKIIWVKPWFGTLVAPCPFFIQQKKEKKKKEDFGGLPLNPETEKKHDILSNLSRLLIEFWHYIQCRIYYLSFSDKIIYQPEDA